MLFEAVAAPLPTRLVTTQISTSSWHKDSKATHMMRFCVIASLFGISAINQEDLK